MEDGDLKNNRRGRRNTSNIEINNIYNTVFDSKLCKNMYTVIDKNIDTDQACSMFRKY